MPLSRKWVALCDEPGCRATLVLDGVYAPWDSRAVAGEAMNDQDWEGGPGSPEVYCPDHWKAWKEDA